MSDALADALRGMVREMVREELAAAAREAEERWLDTRHAAAYLDVHPVTLRKWAAEGRVEYSQEGPGAKMFFSTRTLDRHRQ